MPLLSGHSGPAPTVRDDNSRHDTVVHVVVNDILQTACLAPSVVRQCVGTPPDVLKRVRTLRLVSIGEYGLLPLAAASCWCCSFGFGLWVTQQPFSRFFRARFSAFVMEGRISKASARSSLVDEA